MRRLELAFEGLQDAVYRQDVLHDRGIQELRTRTAELAYGEACAFVIFLRHANDQKYRAVFDEYFSRTNRLRTDGTDNLLAAAVAAGAHGSWRRAIPAGPTSAGGAR